MKYKLVYFNLDPDLVVDIPDDAIILGIKENEVEPMERKPYFSVECLMKEGVGTLEKKLKIAESFIYRNEDFEDYNKALAEKGLPLSEQEVK